MIKVHTRMYDETKPVDKNVLYKINKSTRVVFKEQHEKSQEVVNIDYCLEEQQYAIYANEYRRPEIDKNGCKTADVLSCVFDDSNKKIQSFIFDVKSDISAFSDDLRKENAVLTAIKEVRDFIEQIQMERLHKNSFLLYYENEGYIEEETFGIITKSFEAEKFKNVAKRLEEILSGEQQDIPKLLFLKLQNNLKPYEKEIPRLYDFAEQMIKITGKLYKLQVFLLTKKDECCYQITIKIKADRIICNE